MYSWFDKDNLELCNPAFIILSMYLMSILNQLATSITDQLKSKPAN